jgi:hypothetical protein
VEKHDREIPWSTIIFGLACAKCRPWSRYALSGRDRAVAIDRLGAIQGLLWQREKSTGEKQSTFMHSSPNQLRRTSSLRNITIAFIAVALPSSTLAFTKTLTSLFCRSWFLAYSKGN